MEGETRITRRMFLARGLQALGALDIAIGAVDMMVQSGRRRSGESILQDLVDRGQFKTLLTNGVLIVSGGALTILGITLELQPQSITQPSKPS